MAKGCWGVGVVVEVGGTVGEAVLVGILVSVGVGVGVLVGSGVKVGSRVEVRLGRTGTTVVPSTLLMAEDASFWAAGLPARQFSVQPDNSNAIRSQIMAKAVRLERCQGGDPFTVQIHQISSMQSTVIRPT